MKENKLYVNEFSNGEIVSVFSSLLNNELTIVGFKRFKIDDERIIEVDKLSYNQVSSLLRENEYKILKIKSLSYKKELR